jgi:hypothetical protein
MVLSRLVLALVSALPATSAAPIWSWSFQSADYFVTPSDSIVIRATFMVSPLSTQNFVSGIGGYSSYFAGDLQKRYNWIIDGRTFLHELWNLDLAPGESKSFEFGILKPIRNWVPAGHYQSDPAGIAFGGSGWILATNSFVVHVSDGSNPNPVPEPSNFLLVAAGALALGLKSRLT